MAVCYAYGIHTDLGILSSLYELCQYIWRGLALALSLGIVLYLCI